jgi:hypothetical protein
MTQDWSTCFCPGGGRSGQYCTEEGPENEKDEEEEGYLSKIKNIFS